MVKRFFNNNCRCANCKKLILYMACSLYENELNMTEGSEKPLSVCIYADTAPSAFSKLLDIHMFVGLLHACPHCFLHLTLTDASLAQTCDL
jgi:hypothetical protein